MWDWRLNGWKYHAQSQSNALLQPMTLEFSFWCSPNWASLNETRLIWYSRCLRQKWHWSTQTSCMCISTLCLLFYHSIITSVILLFEFAFTYSIKSNAFIIIRAMNNLGSNQAQNLAKSYDKKIVYYSWWQWEVRWEDMITSHIIK